MKKLIPPVIRVKFYVECPTCNKKLISLHRHDYRTCPCFSHEDGKLGISIDGGDVYTRIGWGNEISPPEIKQGKFEINFNTGKYKLIDTLPDESMKKS